MDEPIRPEVQRALEIANEAARHLLRRRKVRASFSKGQDESYRRELLAQAPHLEKLVQIDPVGCDDAEWLFEYWSVLEPWLRSLGPEGDTLQHPTDIRKRWEERGRYTLHSDTRE